MKKENIVTEFFEQNQQCPYFDDKTSDMRYKYMTYCSSNDHSLMCQRGWRRFGNMHFVPECKNCNQCQTIRIDTNEFKFSKSQRRILAKNKSISVYLQKPTISMDHISLFDKYHKNMQDKKNWKFEPTTPDSYYQSYIAGANDYGKELLYFKDGKLIAVALLDILKNGISAIYCYYDHDYKHLSLGKYSILVQINLAKQLKLKYLYLGYWIKDHYSMGYKEEYKPFEILVNRPKIDEKTIWENYE
jgi:arginine-tRNA-protein transferase